MSSKTKKDERIYTQDWDDASMRSSFLVWLTMDLTTVITFQNALSKSAFVE